MNYFLIDYENVNVAGLNGITKLTEEDIVIIFYSENANTLTFSMHKKINESKAEIKFQKVNINEKNALDFQLCSYLGFLIRDTMTEENLHNYFIVSNDNGYSVLPDYWKRFNANVKIVSNVAKDEVNNVQSVQNPETNSVKKMTELEIVLSNILKNKSEIDEAVKIIKNSKTKVDVNNNLCKRFKEKGGKIYKSVKDFISDKKSN